ncbi:serine/threonine-protein kinase [Paraliomyxa miuraensis]|uniref:serine/threonine-protein kinase n=1 Tax=Paraliomyxa miuraensis TaxID=376150 RepID=UPI00224CC1CD|nr:serine/threonine-protein kinase [Paraliomyxa miuraensis]MCX4242571.1 protein kinase [Paraliomyxa miuraensis]
MKAIAAIALSSTAVDPDTSGADPLTVTPDSGAAGDERPTSVDDEAQRGPLVPNLGMGSDQELGHAGRLLEQHLENRVFGRLFDKRKRLRVGRYDVLETLGQGGMGVVYAAYDHELDRKVAIKVLLGAGDEAAHLRFKREAQAMARLSHANVVTVHEVGEADGRVFIAMEFVRGQSLAQWCAEPRSWQEVVALYIEAGRGLIAAHEAGLVHRDLKPHNIMRGEDGTVKVLDFGLARTDGEAEGMPSRRADERISSGSVLDEELTRTGTLMGTPAYMPPEVFATCSADARSDQFSFCASLYEALHGQLPFEGSSIKALAYNVTHGEPRAPPAGTKVPSWLHRVLLRGLAKHPDERWPSMRALVDALARDPTRRRRRRLAVLVGAALTGASGFAISGLLTEPVQQCTSAGEEIATAWGEAQREAMREAFTGSGHGLAEDTLARVLPRLDAYAEAWSSMRVAACEQHLSGQQSDRLFDLRTACLDRRRASLEALVGTFEHPDAALVEGAAWATASLPAIESCGDVDALTAAVAPPEDPALRDEVQRLRERLAGASSLIDVGRYDDARTRAEEVLARAEEIEYEPLAAEALLRVGSAQLEAYRPEQARMALTRGAAAAIRSGQDEVAAEALARRMWIVAEPLGEPEVGLADAELARAFVDKLGDDKHLRWLFHNNHGAALFRHGDGGQAERAYLEALEVTEDDASPLPVEQISTRFNLATLLYDGARPVAAAAQLRAARDEAIALLGAEHPRSVVISLELAMMLRECGQAHAALALIDDAALGPGNGYLGASRDIALASLRLHTGHWEDARSRADSALRSSDVGLPAQREALARQLHGIARVLVGEEEGGLAELEAVVHAAEAQHGPAHVAVGHARWWLGDGLLRAGRHADAIAELERAEAVYAGLGSFAPALVGRHGHRLVAALLASGRLAEAEVRIAETIAAQDEARLPEDNVHRAVLLDLRGVLRLRQHEPEAARQDHERACAILAAVHEEDDPVLAHCRLRWARALGSDPRALTLARRAYAAFSALGPGFRAARDEAAALLVEPPRGGREPR